MMDGLRKTNPRGISYLTFGSQNNYHPCLVCIHGWSCQANDYSYLLPQLQARGKGFRGIAVDLPGHGESSAEHYPDGSCASMVDALQTLTSDLHLDQIVLMGHSMGMRAILEHWHRTTTLDTAPHVKGLVFLDGSYYKLRKSLFAFDSGDARSKSLSREQRAAGIQAAFERMFSDRTPSAFRESTLARVRLMDLDYSDAMRKSFIAYDSSVMGEVLEKLGRSQVPVLNLQSTDVDDENQRIPLKPGGQSAWMKLLQDKVPQAQQFVVGNSSHFPHVDQTTEVADRILAFLETL